MRNCFRIIFVENNISYRNHKQGQQDAADSSEDFNKTEILTTLAEETVALAVAETEADSDVTETVVLAVTGTGDSAAETMTVASDAELMPRQSDSALLLTKKALKMSSRNNKVLFT